MFVRTKLRGGSICLRFYVFNNTIHVKVDEVSGFAGPEWFSKTQQRSIKQRDLLFKDSVIGRRYQRVSIFLRVMARSSLLVA